MRFPEFLKRRSVISALIGLTLSIAVILMYYLPLVRELEFMLLDIRFELRSHSRWGPTHEDCSDIVIVSVDDQESLNTLKRPYPLPRSYMAKLIRNLKRAGAKLIVADVEFTEPTDAREDLELARAVREAGNVVLAAKLEVYRKEYKHSEYSTLLLPIPEILEGTAGWGLVNRCEDPDGVIRSYFLWLRGGKKILHSLAVVAVRKLREIEGLSSEVEDLGKHFRIGDILVPKRKANTMLINYAGPAGTFAIYPVYAILDDSTFSMPDPDEDWDTYYDYLRMGIFKDKLVLLGSTLKERHDLFPTPFHIATKTLMPGVEIHANAIRSILQRDFIRCLGYPYNWFLIIGLGIVTSLLTFRLRPLMGLVPTVVLMLVITLVCFMWFFKYNFWIEQLRPSMAVAFSYIGSVVQQYMEERRRRQMIRGIFSRYVPESVVDVLIGNPELLRLGGEERELSVLFSDVEGFTTVSERLQPLELANLLNEYLTPMTDVIFKHGGIIDKYEGDAIMAEFGAPVYYPDHAKRACLSAIEMQERLEELRGKWRSEGRPELKARIGINTGRMTVGNMGSDIIFDYTVIGDSVNLASRLEGANKIYGTRIMISEFTYEQAKDYIVARELDWIRVKGKLEPVRVYEVLGRAGDDNIPREKLEAIKYYLEGLELYRAQRWDAALERFMKALSIFPEDSPSKVFARRCQQYKVNPPGEGWDGVYVMLTKE